MSGGKTIRDRDRDRVAYIACRWGSEQFDLTVWILKLTLSFLINKLPVTVT